MCEKKETVEEAGKRVMTALMKDLSFEEREHNLPYKFQELAARTMGISHGEFLGGLKGSCPSCPFNEGRTEIAAYAANTGCLPSAYDIVQMKKQSGQNWGCHDDESKVCAGLCHHAKEEGLNLGEGGIIKYSSWDGKGQDAAIEEARNSK